MLKAEWIILTYTQQSCDIAKGMCKEDFSESS